MLRVFALATGLALAASAAFAGEQSFPLDESGQITFSTPSGNVGCVFTPKGGTQVYEPEDGGPELSCDRVEPVYLRFFLRAKGKAQRYNNVGDVGCCSLTNTLRYGNSWSHAGYTCISAKTGLTCARGKNGFSISKAKTRVY